VQRGRISRRGFAGLVGAGALLLGGAALGLGRLPDDEGEEEGEKGMLTVYTFGDSILDCGHYNEHGVTPGGLLVHNDDRLFPEFRGEDLSYRAETRLNHRAVDGATVEGLPSQAQGLSVEGRSIALLTIGGNDLISGLAEDDGPGVQAFARALQDFLKRLPVRPVLVGNVYDPSFGDDRNNFLGVEPRLARENHRRVNAVLAEMGDKYGALADLHAHFLTGDPSWYTYTIEPSLRGASEVRRVFLPLALRYV
jgi:acyl-CoA thioesterase I